jgi:uncharacterized protein YneR
MFVNVPWTDTTIPDTNTTYSISAVDSGANAIIRLTAGGSGSGADDVTLVAGSNITLTPSGDNITIASSYVDTNTTYSISAVDSGSDAIIRLTAGGSGSGTDDVTLVAGSNITLTPSGDNITIASSYVDTIPNNATITIQAGSGLTTGGDFTTNQGTDETITLAHSDTSSQSSMTTGGRTYVNSITLDGFGHVTALGTNTETVVNTNTATHADGIMDGSNSGTEVSYDPYTTQQAKLSFDTSASLPSRTERLNINGNLYTTQLNTNKIGGVGTELRIGAGEALASITGTAEAVYIAGESGVYVYASSDNLTSGLDKSSTLIDTSGNASFGGDVSIAGDLIVTGTTITNNVETVSTSNGVIFEGSAADDFEATLLAGTLTADRTLTLPDKTGTLAVTSDISDTNTTYSISAVDSGANAIIRLTAGGSGSGTDDVTLVAGSNITLTPSGDNITIESTNTLNTAGSTDTTSTIYLIGATTQSSSATTYSDSEVYVNNGSLTAATLNAGTGGTTSWSLDGASSNTFYLKDSGGTSRLSVSNAGAVTAASFDGNLDAADLASGIIPYDRYAGTGLYSVALGGSVTADDSYTVAIGSSASATDPYGVSIGYNAMNVSRGGIAIGALSKAYSAGYSFNIALGYNANAGYTNGGTYNTAIGPNAKAYGNTSISIGSSTTAGNSESTSDHAIAIGPTATASGNRSISIGRLAAGNGDYSIAVGYDTDAGPACTVIGANASISSSYSNSTALGATSTVDGSNQIRLGDSFITDLKCYDTSISSPSDIRDKADIADLPSVLNFLKDIDLITYVKNERSWYIKNIEDMSEEELEIYKRYGDRSPYDKEAHSLGLKKKSRRRVGVKAQQVYEKMIEHFGTDNFADLINISYKDEEDIPEFIEDKYFARYSNFIPLLIKAIQEQQEQIELLKIEINELKKE